MADFCITAVQYNPDKKHIDLVQVREEKYGGKVATESRLVQRAFLVDLIRLGLVSFQTKTKDRDGNWRDGDKVTIYDDKYLTTKGNGTERDNLGSLPEF